MSTWWVSSEPPQTTFDVAPLGAFINADTAHEAARKFAEGRSEGVATLYLYEVSTTPAMFSAKRQLVVELQKPADEGEAYP